MDFFQIGTREIEKGQHKGSLEIFPDFTVGRSKDLMVRGRSFYAIWDEETQLWSTDEYDVQRLVDQALQEFAKKEEAKGRKCVVRYLRSFGNNGGHKCRSVAGSISHSSTHFHAT